MSAYRIVIATGKGGAGKTSVSSSLAGTYARFGRRTCLVELDPQGDLADDLGLRDDPRNDGGETVLHALHGHTLTSAGFEARPGLTYIPGGPLLGFESLSRSMSQGWDGLDGALRKAIDSIDADYDMILIDTPPSIEPLQHAGLSAADRLLISTGPDISSLRALFAITARLLRVKDVQPTLDYLGVVMFNVPSSASRVRADVRSQLLEILGERVPLFDATIRSSVATAVECRNRGILPFELVDQGQDAEPFWKALAEGRTPERVPSAAQALATDYAELADEILRKIGKEN